MTQPNPPSEQVESFARRYRKAPGGSFYAAFAGSVEHSLNTAGFSETERLTRISDALTALDMVRAEGRAIFTVPAAVPLVDEAPAEPVTVHFTFGVGHFDGATDLFGRYVTVVGPSWQRCRQAMVNRYGGAWCDQYSWDSPTFRQMRDRLTEHARIVVDGESTVRLVLDDVHAEALAENAEAH